MQFYFTTIASLLITLSVAAETHWSLQPIKRAKVPNEVHPIDYFIERKLKENKLTFSPLADRSTLLRRATLDLTGLPPTFKAMNMFLKNKQPTKVAFEDALQTHLTSPHYG